MSALFNSNPQAEAEAKNRADTQVQMLNEVARLQEGLIKAKFNDYASARNKELAAANEGRGRQATLMTDLTNQYGKADTISLI